MSETHDITQAFDEEALMERADGDVEFLEETITMHFVPLWRRARMGSLEEELPWRP